MSKGNDEKEPFQKIRLTLSDTALEMLGELRKVSAFRSDSATLEECIRSMWDIADDISTQLHLAKNEKRKLTSNEEVSMFERIAMRIRRFLN